MAENRVMKLWTAIITAFLALCTALGFVTTTATTAVAQTEPTRNTGKSGTTAHPTVSTMSPWSWLHARSLPPTMKQRIRAEAHGKSPSCRHRHRTEAEPADHLLPPCEPESIPADPTPPIPRQR
ncbi:DUF6344 domain-containing protein [Streptomyces aurantiogriseus]|uniref:Secreted protein n=1 Tax=Streptomyces aurantiogriseus TaxID=66870 RepID=A0A918F1M4_9ACTN|nr:DUF6344 domain-containing protein [Streptomyces aurantiogriseus]GGQ92672.1 hypothetical protein GCM10010251_04170 [Streptomyces aurantiogriseus]